MMHLYSALLHIAVHPKRFTIMWGGLSSTTTRETLKSLRQPTSADLLIFSTCFKFIQQKVEKTQKSPTKISWENEKNLLKLVALNFWICSNYIFFLQCSNLQYMKGNVHYFWILFIYVFIIGYVYLFSRLYLYMYLVIFIIN